MSIAILVLLEFTSFLDTLPSGNASTVTEVELLRVPSSVEPLMEMSLQFIQFPLFKPSLLSFS